MATLNYAVVFDAAHKAGHAAWHRECWKECWRKWEKPQEDRMDTLLENCGSFVIQPRTSALVIAAQRHLDAQPTDNGDGVRVHNQNDMPFTRTRAYLDVFAAVCRTVDPAAQIIIETE